MIFFSYSYAQEESNVSIEEKITSLYVTFFQRAPDYDGLIYWSSQAKEGGDDVLKKLSLAFSKHPLFISTYANLNNQLFVEAIYRNALGEAGDSEGINYWIGLLDNGLSRSDMIAIFLDTTLSNNISKETKN